ncbi:MAG: class I SAM-dependent methyltransferase [Saonia sp.]
MFNKSDQIIWDSIFSNVPPEWTQPEVSEAMRDCLKYYNRNNVRTVLDLGCGIGIWAMFFSKSNLKVSGVDFSRKAIDFAKKWAQSENQEIIYECSPLIDNPFINKAFDGILASKILDNISNEELLKAKTQIYGNLNQNGVLYGLFNPYMTEENSEELSKRDNPTKGITSINLTDNELKELFPKLNLLEFRHYEHGFRGLIWQKEAN